MRNALLVAAIVAALGLGVTLWYALAPSEEQLVAGAAAPNPDAKARPDDSGGQGQVQGQQPTSQTADAGGTTSEPAAAPAGSETQMAAAPATPPAATQPAVSEPAASEPAASQPVASQPSAAQPADSAPAAEPAPPPPSFDIVRVEQDGSAVIAGRAPAGSTITLLDGEVPLASAKAGPDGSFALILDQPLAPGSRALSLAATTPDGTTVPSAGEVVVVVPQPATAAAVTTADSVTAGSSAATTTTEPAASTAGTEAAGTETASTETASTEAAGAEPASSETAGTETASTEAAGTEAAGTEAAATESAGTASGSGAASGTTSEGTAADAAAGTAAVADAAPAAVAPATPLVVASSPEGASVVLQAPGDLTGDTLRIEAVDYDLEGQVIVSGRGPASGTVALYLDGALLGQTQADAAGRWVFKPDAPVAAGLHRLRADLLAADGSVTARAEIPFSRAEPIQLAANEDFVIVQPGNSLWVIARGKYGEGIRYSTIYEANAGQIRNPDLIYPGQIFLVPQVN